MSSAFPGGTPAASNLATPPRVVYGAPGVYDVTLTVSNGHGSDTESKAGYVVVQAESHEAAAKMFEGHPHFTIFPGDSVEIMECLPIPEM